jgi:hypothetical protein
MTARALRSKRKEERHDSRGVLKAEGGGAFYRSREWGAQAPPVVVVASKTTPLMGRGDGGGA